MRRITWLIALVLAARRADGGRLRRRRRQRRQRRQQRAPASTAPAPRRRGETLTVTADPGGAISWDKSELSAPAGKVTLKIVNESDMPHAIEVEGNGVEEETKTVTGGNAEVTVDLKAGHVRVLLPGRQPQGDDEGHAHRRVIG